MSENQAEILIQSFLKQNAFIRFHADSARILGGISQAILFQFLIDRDNYYNSSDGWFYLTEKIREEYTCISDRQQRRIIKKLIEDGFLETDRRGIPPKQYFKINYKKYAFELGKIDRIDPVEKTESNRTKTKEYILNNNKKDNIYKSNTNVLDKELEPTGSTLSQIKKLSRKKEFKKKGKIQNTPKNSKKNLFLEKWNSYPQVRHHKDPNSKVYKKAVTLLRALKSGTFLNKVTLNQNSELAFKNWHDSMILDALKDLSNIFTEGYWPKDKSKLPKDLPTLIYNPNTKKSMLLLVYENQYGKLNKFGDIDISEIGDNYVEWFLRQDFFNYRWIDPERTDPSDIKQLIANIKDYQQKFISFLKMNNLFEKFRDPFYEHEWGKEDYVLDLYVDWVEKYSNPDNIDKLSKLEIGKLEWRNFLEDFADQKNIPKSWLELKME